MHTYKPKLIIHPENSIPIRNFFSTFPRKSDFFPMCTNPRVTISSKHRIANHGGLKARGSSTKNNMADGSKLDVDKIRSAIAGNLLLCEFTCVNII